MWLAGALIRVAGSLADRARAIALDENGVDYAAARWVVERAAVAHYVRAAEATRA